MLENKQIIIHGVDVSRCKKYKHEIERCNTLLKNLCFGSALDCTHEKSKNCYYKQLKRKEQECDELKEQLESTKGLVTVGNKKLKEYLKENIKLKVQQERYFQILSDIQDEARDGYCSGTQTGCENSLHKILQKINECEVDNG